MEKFRRVFVFFVFLLLTVSTAADAGEFDFSEMSPDEVVSIPGTNMKAGIFRYEFQETYEGRHEYARTRKAGIIVNDEVIYYVSVEGMEGSSVDPGGDTNFGVHKDYFIMDSFSYGASHNRKMYLFRFKGNNVEFLDMIRMAYVGEYTLDFVSVYAGEKKRFGFLGSNLRRPTWTDVKDFDGDGNPEVNIVIPPNFNLELYLEIKNDRIHVDFNPALYKPLFERERSKKRKKKFDAYYIYGFLSGELTLDKIRGMPMLKAEQRERVLSLITIRDEWDAAFHQDYGEKPVLMKRNIKKGR